MPHAYPSPQSLANLKPVKPGEARNPLGINATTKRQKLMDYLATYFADEIDLEVNGTKVTMQRSEALAKLIGAYAMRIGDDTIDRVVWKVCFDAVMERIAPVDKSLVSNVQGDVKIVFLRDDVAVKQLERND